MTKEEKKLLKENHELIMALNEICEFIPYESYHKLSLLDTDDLPTICWICVDWLKNCPEGATNDQIDTYNNITDWLYDILYAGLRDADLCERYNVESWSDYDPMFPNNTVLSGIRIGEYTYNTHYSGIAGNYWDTIIGW